MQGSGAGSLSSTREKLKVIEKIKGGKMKNPEDNSPPYFFKKQRQKNSR